MDLCPCPTPNKRKSLSFYESKCISTDIGIVGAPIFTLFTALFKQGSPEYTLAEKMNPRASENNQRCKLGHHAALCILNKHLTLTFLFHFLQSTTNASECTIELLRIKLCNVFKTPSTMSNK